MKTKFFLYTAIFAFAATAACSDDKDTTGPEIRLISPENEDVFTRGDELPIVFELADPSGINEYKIDIHYSGGEHAHSHSLSATLTDEEEEEPWEYEYIQDGQAYDGYKKGETFAHVTLTPTVPPNAQGGEYHLGILATDMAGNESKVYIDIDIEE
jgi:hypothetical protein